MSKATLPPSPTYKTQQFASLTGVSVRALHHYDRLGLLRPRRSPAGYRIYTDGQVAVVEQIVALKFIGLPLSDIKGVLRRGPADLVTILEAQRRILEEKRRLLDLAITAIHEAQTVAASQPNIAALRSIIEVIEMQNRSTDWTKKYDTLLTAKIERLRTMSPETRAALGQQWGDLLKAVEAAVDEDPASPVAQELGGRWLNLLAS